MKRYRTMIGAISFVLTLLFIHTPQPDCADGDILLGITWTDSLLVSFDPYAGTITEVHTQLNPNDSFRGLAYDSNRNMLYALSQVNFNLYAIDPLTLAVQHIGNLHIPCCDFDIGGLTYDPSTDRFYTTLSNTEGDSSELLAVDVNTAEVTSLGSITNGDCFSPSYNENDGRIYGFALYGSGSWDSPYKASVVSINPDDATMTTLFETPYHTILGLAKKPGENIFYTWVNWTSHTFSEIDLDSRNITPLGNSDAIDVASDAMLFKHFAVNSGALLPTEEEPIEFDFTGHVTEIWDPYNLLDGDIVVGDQFSGRFNYDRNGLYLHTLGQSSYGISVEVNGRAFAFSGWQQAEVVNNYYAYNSDTTYDYFTLESEIWDDAYNYISFSLTDHSTTALSNEIFLPDHFDLTAWDENDFHIYSGSYDSEEPGFSIHGVVDQISTTTPDDGGTSDDSDLCPDDPDKTEPGICGCGIADTDSDGDGTPDCIDICADDPDKTDPGICGCDMADTDSDGDGTIDCQDAGNDGGSPDGEEDPEPDGNGADDGGGSGGCFITTTEIN